MLLKCNATRKDNIDCYKGAGYYRIAYSDGGQDYTCDGPVWFDSFSRYAKILENAMQYETPTHLAYSVYLGVRLPVGAE